MILYLLLVVSSKFFSNLGLENITIDISHRKLVQSYINEIFQEENQQTVFDMLRAVDKIQKKSKKEIISEYEKKGYSKELVKSRVLTVAILAGIIIGYIMGNIIPIN